MGSNTQLWRGDCQGGVPKHPARGDDLLAVGVGRPPLKSCFRQLPSTQKSLVLQLILQQSKSLLVSSHSRLEISVKTFNGKGQSCSKDFDEKLLLARLDLSNFYFGKF